MTTTLFLVDRNVGLLTTPLKTLPLVMLLSQSTTRLTLVVTTVSSKRPLTVVLIDPGVPKPMRRSEIITLTELARPPRRSSSPAGHTVFSNARITGPTLQNRAFPYTSPRGSLCVTFSLRRPIFTVVSFSPATKLSPIPSFGVRELTKPKGFSPPPIRGETEIASQRSTFTLDEASTDTSSGPRAMSLPGTVPSLICSPTISSR